MKYHKNTQRRRPVSRTKVIELLNRLLADQRFSLVDYLNDARPWTHRGNEALLEALHQIVEHHQHYAQRLADAIADRDGLVNSGTYPMSFTSLNDLALDYLLGRLIENQRRNIQLHERCVAELREDPQASSLASEVLGSDRAQLEMLMEFVPTNEAVPGSVETQPLVA